MEGGLEIKARDGLGGMGRQATEQMIYQDTKQPSDHVQEKRGQCKLEEGGG